MSQRTFYIEGKKVVIKTYYSQKKAGFIVRINDKKFFNTGAPWAKDDFPKLKKAQRVAEDRCYVKWVKQQNKTKE